MSEGAMAEYEAAKISVWWDVGTCPVPRRRFGIKAIVENIKSALLKLGHHGPVSISAYGDTSDMPLSDQSDLNTIGISFNHVRPGSCDLLLSLVGWAIDNPSPANILVISGHDFIPDALSFLVKRGYNIMLALPKKAYPPRRFEAPPTVWFWTSLLAGGSPIGVDKSEEMIGAECLGAKTSVWWYIEKFPPIPGGSLKSMARNIKYALKNLTYSGPVSIFAYGDIPDIPRDLSSTTEITFNHLPPGNKSERQMIFDMMSWALDNPAPANFLLISGDSLFSPAMHHLAESGYNILLALPKSASLAAGAAKTVWIWDHLFAGLPPIKRSQVTVSQGGGKVPLPIQMKKYTIDEYWTAKTSVWWDMEDCAPPSNWDQSFAENIKRALSNIGFRGPVSIFAYTHARISYNVRRDATLTGISVNPIASGEELNPKYSRVKKMIVEMFAWALENAGTPANILLISGDWDFCSTLDALEKKGFNVLLGTDMDEFCAPMIAVAKTVWPYVDLLAGELPVKDSSDRNVQQIQLVA